MHNAAPPAPTSSPAPSAPATPLSTGPARQARSIKAPSPSTDLVPVAVMGWDWADLAGRHMCGTVPVEPGFKSRGASDVAHVEVDRRDRREQRGVDEQAADVDAPAVAVLRDLEPGLHGLRARDQRVDVGELVVGER